MTASMAFFNGFFGEQEYCEDYDYHFYLGGGEVSPLWLHEKSLLDRNIYFPIFCPIQLEMLMCVYVHCTMRKFHQWKIQLAKSRLRQKIDEMVNYMQFPSLSPNFHLAIYSFFDAKKSKCFQFKNIAPIFQGAKS